MTENRVETEANPEVSVEIPCEIVSNQELHQQAVKLLLEFQATKVEIRAGEVRKSYNQRRKDATAELRPVLAAIWKAFERGETVAGYASKEVWAKSQSIKIRQVQKIIAGPQPKKAYSLRLVSNPARFD